MSSLGNKKIMANNIKYYMNLNLIDRNKLCSDLGIKYTTLCDWINGKTYPRIDNIELMANYFGIEKSDLVEDRNEMRRIRLFSGLDSIIKNRENDTAPTNSGITFIDIDGSTKAFDVNSIVYAIMESVIEMSPEQQNLVNNMVSGNKKTFHVNNPSNKHTVYPEKLNAAHVRTDIEVTEDMLKHDDDIMDSDDF